jgi:phosphoribosylglycinamide formyltransferase-1
MKIAIFASGSGSNAEALMKKAKELTGVKIEFVFSDKKEAFVLTRAKSCAVPAYVIEKKGTREKHEQEILHLLDDHKIDWILLAGYMRMISPTFLRELKNRHEGHAQVINVHPSLLPDYPGTDSIQKAYKDQVAVSGVSIHYVDEGMDTGPLLAQEKVILQVGETLESFATRMHALEHQMYCKVLEQIANQELITRTYKRKP